MKIRLTRADVQKALEFAKAVASTKTQSAGGAEAFEEALSNNFIGRLGEIALQRFLSKDKGLAAALDDTIYPANEGDRCDIIHKGWWIDVKCTATAVRHLRIECAKLARRAEAGELPHFFVAAHLLDCDPAEAIANPPETVQIDLAGWIDVRELDANNPKVLTVEGGTCIPGTRNEVAHTSFCVAYADLCRNWDRLAEMLATRKAFDRSVFRIPTGACGAEQRQPEHATAGAKDPRYSLLLAGDEADRSDPAELARLVKRGVRIFLFTKTPGRFSDLEAQGRGRVAVYGIDDFIRPFSIVDGKSDDVTDDDMRRLSEAAPFFNPEQYAIEHAPADRHIIVRASAGTGKTTVMIDRITYLFATDPTLRPSDVGMITFTNKATDSMLGKLQKRMTDMYELTGDARWLSILEELGELELGTIDTFFLDVVRTEGAALGYGVGARVVSFQYEKDQIIRDLLDAHYRRNGGHYLRKYIIADYNYVEIVREILDTLHNYGYFDESLIAADYGSGHDNSDMVNKVVVEIVREAEARYRALKEESNAFEVDDIQAGALALAQLDLRVLHRKKLRYLFIDEFQDTDLGQIKTVAWLQRAMGCRLFAVGDVKQSIYRFRGAEESAFAALEEQLAKNNIDPESILQSELVKNYRTSPDIVSKLNGLFEGWGEKGLLQWNTDAVSALSMRGRLDVVRCKFDSRAQYDAYVMRRLRELVDDARSTQKAATVCMLARTNNDVKRFARLCADNGIRCYGKTDGDFFRCAPVLDLAAVFAALLRPYDTRALWNAFMTPYAAHRPDPETVAGFEGDEARILAYLRELLELNGWATLVRDVKYDVFFPFVERLVERFDPAARVERLVRRKPGSTASALEVKAEAKYEAEFYRLNLNKVLELLSKRFSADGATLSDACRFLELSIRTNRSEDTLYPEFDDRAVGVRVEAMTVHKAKGLEFDTVFLPYTSKDFYWLPESPEVLVAEKDGTVRVGWATSYWKTPSDPKPASLDGLLHNSVYEEIVSAECKAIARDEARLLYVALTRARRRLTVLLENRPEVQMSWTKLMEL